MTAPETEKLLEKLAQLIDAKSKAGDMSSLQKSIDSINERLTMLETVAAYPQSAHPSQERFAIAEAIADNLFDRYTKEKACTFEPNGKPCDHCSMCNSLGF